MAERLRVSPSEALAILLNEIYVGSHYNQEVAKALHGHLWDMYYNPEDKDSFKPEDLLQDSQRSQLLFDGMDQALETLTARERRAVRLRFGQEDDIVHTLKEIGREFGIKQEPARQIISRSLRKLRHPSRLKLLKPFLPERS